MPGLVLILGKDGQVGRALTSLLGNKALAASRADIDLANPDFIAQLERFTQGKKLSAVINAAAYTQVDKAESEPELAMRVNAQAVGDLAGWAKAKQLPLVHYSTDYVFDGIGNAARREDAPTNPLNIYGKSKLAGERLIVEQGGQYLILRTSWVYDAQGKNFFNTMLRLFLEKDSLNIVADQVGAPTYAPHLAEATRTILERALDMPAFPSGIYHLCARGAASWHDFASAILALASARISGIKCQQVNPIPATDYPTPAKRPLNSRLDCYRAEQVFGVILPSWREGLKECFEEKNGRSGLQNPRT